MDKELLNMTFDKLMKTGRPFDSGQSSANATQVGGQHYAAKPIQPWDFIAANELDYFEGNVVKYISRWRNKNGIADLEKAKHYIELLIELENRKADKECGGA